MKMTLAKAVKWIPAGGLLLVLAAFLAVTSHPWGIDDRVYRIGWENDPPFQQKGEDGTPSGLAVELVREAARRSGIRLEWVWQPGSSEDALRGNRVDLWPLITLTPERKQFIHFTDPYLQHEHCFLVRAASAYSQPRDLAQATVTHYDQPIDRQFARTILPEARLVAKSSLKEAIEDVCRQEADAAYVEEFSAVSALLAGPSCFGQPLRMISIPDVRTRLGVGSTFGAAAAADRIREGIGAIPADELTRLMTRWGYFSPRNLDTMNALLSARRRERRLMAAVGLFACLLALALFEADRIRRQRNRIRMADQALRENEQKLRLMANNLTEMVLAYDMDRNLIFANPAVERLTGYSMAELQKEGFICWVHPDDRSRMLGYWENLFRGSAFQDEEYRLVAKDGREK
jgi:PAS domain S-box-containing protein